MNVVQINEKIKTYEDFIEDRLKIDLREIESMLKKKTAEHKEWQDLQHIVRALQDSSTDEINMSLHLGHGVHCEGLLEEKNKTVINIGLGYCLEMDYDEAIKYANIRLKVLQKEINHYQKLAVLVKVNIKITLLAINELEGTKVT